MSHRHHHLPHSLRALCILSASAWWLSAELQPVCSPGPGFGGRFPRGSGSLLNAQRPWSFRVKASEQGRSAAQDYRDVAEVEMLSGGKRPAPSQHSCPYAFKRLGSGPSCYESQHLSLKQTPSPLLPGTYASTRSLPGLASYTVPHPCQLLVQRA